MIFLPLARLFDPCSARTLRRITSAVISGHIRILSRIDSAAQLYLSWISLPSCPILFLRQETTLLLFSLSTVTTVTTIRFKMKPSRCSIFSLFCYLFASSSASSFLLANTYSYFYLGGKMSLQRHVIFT
jgi:hypothetical protein